MLLGSNPVRLLSKRSLFPLLHGLSGKPREQSYLEPIAGNWWQSFLVIVTQKLDLAWVFSNQFEGPSFNIFNNSSLSDGLG